jgi:PAS domain S-box-containing protein
LKNNPVGPTPAAKKKPVTHTDRVTIGDVGQIGFDRVLDSLPQGIRIIDKNWVVQRINKSFSELSGVSPQDAVGRRCWEVFPSQFCHTSDCRLKRILGGEKMVQTEIERDKKDGTTVPCLVTAFPMLDETGKLIGVMESFRDISEKRQLKAQFKESEERYEALIELSNKSGEAVVILQNFNKQEGIQTFISDQWSKITGYSREELLHTCFFDLVHPDNRQKSQERHRNKMSAKTIPGIFETNIISKYGETIPIELTGALITYNGQPANVVYIKDVSQKHKLEKELLTYRDHLLQLVEERTIQLQNAMDGLTREILKREEVERALEKQKNSLQSLLDAIPAGIYLIDRDARITYANKAGEKSIALPLEKIVGLTAAEIHPDRDYSNEAVQTDLRVIKTGKPERTVFTNYEPQGERWFTLDRYPYYNANDEVEGGIIVEVEITDRIKIENRLEELLEEERRLKDQLESQINQRIEFTRALVHELKTPTTPLLMASELLINKASDAETRRIAEVINHGAEALVERIDELLDIAKGEIGMLKLNRQMHDISEICREVSEYMDFTFKTKNQKYTTDIPKKMPACLVDDQRIRQGLINLLDNASKYTPRGGEINLKAVYDEHEVVLTVTDNGMGIAETNHEDIFKPYYGLKHNLSLRGLGLGLSLTKMLVDLHGGTINVTSSEGKGSTFVLSLPIRRDTA